MGLQLKLPGGFKLLIIIILFLVPALLPAQNNKSRIDRIRGGFVGLKLKWTGKIFGNSGTRADAWGGTISTLDSGAEVLSWNPAGLGFARGFHASFDWSVPLNINPDGLLGIQKGLNDALLTTAKNNSPNGVVAPGTVDDAVVKSKLDMTGGLKGGALLYGNPIFAVAASFNESFRLETQMNMSGFEFNAVALNDQGEETHRIFGTLNGNFNLDLSFFTSTIGFGTRLLPNLSLGLAYDNFNAETTFEGTFLPEGIISTRNSQAFFNDPRKTQYDSLYAIIRGNWKGNGFRLRTGLGYHPRHNISFDAVLILPATIDLSGPFTMIHNQVRALNLGAGENEEVLDVDVLLEDNLTKTVKKITRVPGIDIKLPGQASVGVSSKWKNYVASIVFTRYFHDLGYHLTYEQFDSLNVLIKGGEINQGIRLKNAIKLGIGVEQLILGLGVIFGETFRQETVLGRTEPKVDKPTTFFVPLFSLGGGFKFKSRLRFDYVVSPYHSSFFRFSTSYQL